MNNAKHVTIGGIIILIATLVVLGGLLYWALGGEKEIDVEGQSIVSFELRDDAFIASSVNLDQIEVRYLPAGDNPAEVVFGTMVLETTDEGGIQNWSRALPDNPLLVQSVTAHGFVDGVEVDAIELSADDLAELRVLWFEVPTQQIVLKIGEKQMIDGLEIALEDILEDSRCPANANCITAGQVRAQVRLTTSQAAQTVVMSTNGEGVGFDNYFVEIDSVEPQAVLDVEIPRALYEVVFAVSRDIKL